MDWQLWDRKAHPSKATSDMPKDVQLRHDCEAMLKCCLKPLEEIDEKTGKPKTIFCVGKTRSYFKMGAVEYLESHRSSGLESHAIMMQRIARSFLSRKCTSAQDGCRHCPEVDALHAGKDGRTERMRE